MAQMTRNVTPTPTENGDWGKTGTVPSQGPVRLPGTVPCFARDAFLASLRGRIPSSGPSPVFRSLGSRQSSIGNETTAKCAKIAKIRQDYPQIPQIAQIPVRSPPSATGDCKLVTANSRRSRGCIPRSTPRRISGRMPPCISRRVFAYVRSRIST